MPVLINECLFSVKMEAPDPEWNKLPVEVRNQYMADLQMAVREMKKVLIPLLTQEGKKYLQTMNNSEVGQLLFQVLDSMEKESKKQS